MCVCVRACVSVSVRSCSGGDVYVYHRRSLISSAGGLKSVAKAASTCMGLLTRMVRHEIPASLRSPATRFRNPFDRFLNIYFSLSLSGTLCVISVWT